MEEREPTQVENGSAMPPPRPTPVAANARPPARSGGCLGRLFAGLLTVLVAAALALLAGAGGLLALGFTPDTPQQIADARAQLATVQAQSMALQIHNSALQTQVASQSQRGDTDHETLGDLRRQLADLDALQAQIRQDREDSARQSATLVAEARTSRDAVALFATAEAGRAALLERLEQRSARIERFLQRLSDIAGDASADLGAATTLPSAAPPPVTDITATATPTGTPTPAPTGTPTPAATRTPTPTSGR